MHTSTSPQYGIIASLDVAARMMDGPQGTALVDGAVDEALAFRRELAANAAACVPGDWCFRAWQPPEALRGTPAEQRDPARWVLRDGQDWHGYAPDARRSCDARSDQGHDPHPRNHPRRQVSSSTASPRRSSLGSLTSVGSSSRRPARTRSSSCSRSGVTRGKAGTLLAELFEFKHLYDERRPAHPGAAATRRRAPDRYGHDDAPTAR